MTASTAPTTLDPADPWGTFRRSAFRLETLPEYRVPQEAGLLERYLSGAPIPDGFNVTWHRKIGSWAAAGAVLQRVRVVRPPLTEYERFEFDWGYTGNLQAGEDTRVLDGAVADELGLPRWDFWFFDDQVVHRMNYAEDGTYLGGETLLDADPAEFRRYRELALANSTVFWTYRALTGT